MKLIILLVSSFYLNLGCISNTKNQNDDRQLSSESERVLSKNSTPGEISNKGLGNVDENDSKTNSVDKEGQEITSINQKNELIKYANINRLGADAQERFLDKGFTGYNLITSSTIDKNGEEKFDEVAIRAYLNKFYRDKNSTGLLVVNWEKVKFFDLKEIASSEKFKIAEKEFIRLIKFIKSERPRITVGIYGLPFRVFNNKYPRYGEKNKLENILRECDVICPSLYAKFSDTDIGADKTDLYLKNNLEVAIDYSKLLNIPVLPFVWEIIQDNKSDKRLMPLSQFRRQMEMVASLSSEKTQTSGVHGVIWWTPSNPADFYKGLEVRQESQPEVTALRAETTGSEMDTRDDILVDYINKIF